MFINDIKCVLHLKQLWYIVFLYLAPTCGNIVNMLDFHVS